MTDIAWIDPLISAARPRAVAALLRYFRDLDLAEEAFQDACLRALKNWPQNGPPRDPTAWLIFACGRYEGIDARVVEHFREQVDVRELSIGDYVLAGGEAAVLVMAEATIRLLPGVLGNAESAPDDSFSPTREGAPLEGPIYTKPQVWRGLEVPAVLRSGDHGAVADWRRAQSVQRTSELRPDLAQDDLR